MARQRGATFALSHTMKRESPPLWVGTSGYVYKHWTHGVFYPEAMPAREWLAYYATRFDTVEINNSFYRLPPPEVFAAWHAQTPPEFTFFVKGSRFVSHMKKFKDPVEPLQRFFRSVAPLREKLLGVLWQTPKNFSANAERLDAFCAEFRRHSRIAPLVFEFRHPSWFNAEVTDILERYGAAYCDADMPDFYRDLKIPITANYTYIRRHGGMDHGGNYSNAELHALARHIRAERRAGRTVFVYFNNDQHGNAFRNAETVLRLSRAPARAHAPAH